MRRRGRGPRARAVMMLLALGVCTTARPARADRLASGERANLRRRLEAVPPDDVRFANARLLLGAMELGDERPLAAARALEDALAAGVRPRATALSLLLWSWARAGDRPRAQGALARWPQAPRALVRRVAGPWARADVSLAAGHDTNVRLDTDRSDAPGAGVGASWVAASAGLTVRPAKRRERLAAQLGLDQRVHVSERATARLYDVGRVTLGGAWDQGEALHVRVDVWGQETFGDDLGAHLEHAARLDVRVGAHPPGRFEAGLWLGGGLRDLDGRALGDPGLDAQDGGRFVAGVQAEATLGVAATSVALRAGYHQDVTRGRDWNAQGVETHLAAGLRPGPLELSIDASWLYRRFDDAVPARDEHHVGAGLEMGVPLGPVAPFVRASGEWNVTEAPHAFDRWIVAAGVAASWEAP